MAAKADTGLEEAEEEVSSKVEASAGDLEALSALQDELSSLLDITNTLRTPPPRIDLSPFECSALQRDEVEVLKSIYGEDMVPLNEQGTCFVVNIKFLSGEISEEDVIKVWFSLPTNYPSVPPVFEIEANQSGSFTYRDADVLFDLLMEECLKRAGEMMMFDMISIAQEHLSSLVKEKHALALKREEEEKAHTKQLELEAAFEKKSDKVIPDHLLEDSETKEAASDFGFDHRSQPRRYIGSISDLIKKLPEGMELIRIENVTRQDLTQRFNQALSDMTNSCLWQWARSNPHTYNITPQIAFHGTRSKSLPSIVHHGLVIPGQDNKVGVCHGSSLGVGIYLSPYADYSYHYSDSNRLIVCAVLLGRMYRNRREQFKGKYCSIISTSECEWVVFNAAQVLPCYVIEVREGVAKSHAPVRPPLSSLLGSSSELRGGSAESAQDKKARLMSRARKFLPYGYGPGSSTVIEDAASFDDDEEDYGDYQLLRYGDTEGLAMGDTEVTSELQTYRYLDKEQDTGIS